MTAANTPPRIGTWLRATVTLADGRTLELTIPAAVAGAVATYEPTEGEVPSITLEIGGRRRRGRLDQLLGPT